VDGATIGLDELDARIVLVCFDRPH